MSSLKNKDIKELLKEFKCTEGYFLNWSNNQFEEFFEEFFDIEIYDEEFGVNGNSKGKRFKTFLQIADDSLIKQVLRTLRA